MEYLGQDYLKKRIEKHQKFLLKLLHLHIGDYYPLREWLGISYKGKIDEISHLSFGYNTHYFKRGKQWYKRQTRVYQQPDLGYKLNLILDKIPQLSFAIPALLRPAYGLEALMFFLLDTATYQPTIADGFIRSSDNNSYSDGNIDVGYKTVPCIDRGLIKWDLTDLTNPSFIDAEVSLADAGYSAYAKGKTITIYRSTQPNWTEDATWNKYDGIHDWANPGGDFTTTNSVSTTCTGRGLANPSNDWMHFTSAQNLVQDCYDNQGGYVALEIRLPNNESGSYVYQWIRSRESDHISERPKLTVTYEMPITSNALLFGINI